MNRRPPDPNAVPTIAERRRLIEVNRAAARFFRRELLRTTKGWAGRYLTRAGARHFWLPSRTGQWGTRPTHDRDSWITSGPEASTSKLSETPDWHS